MNKDRNKINLFDNYVQKNYNSKIYPSIREYRIFSVNLLSMVILSI